MKRHTIRTPKNTSTARASGFNRVASNSNVETFFNFLGNVYDEHNLTPGRIYNYIVFYDKAITAWLRPHQGLVVTIRQITEIYGNAFVALCVGFSHIMQTYFLKLILPLL